MNTISEAAMMTAPAPHQSKWVSIACAMSLVAGTVAFFAPDSSVWSVLWFALSWYTGKKSAHQEESDLNLWLHFLGGAGFWTSLLMCVYG
ncbi:MAG: hypothetical protein U1F68_10350 [Gammaproteobacteria bacterium]